MPVKLCNMHDVVMVEISTVMCINYVTETYYVEEVNKMNLEWALPHPAPAAPNKVATPTMQINNDYCIIGKGLFMIVKGAWAREVA